jgi:prepilin-type N-terminal cleavage/methylation domain-containing protein/prepilin-type processing-associated H-X9-DG protein
VTVALVQWQRGRRPAEFGVTLIELLVVVAIIGVLVALLLPAVQTARESARRSQCQNNLHQIGVALHNYHDAYRSFPIGCIEKRTRRKPAARQLAWSASLLPYLEQTALWEQTDFDAAYDSVENAAAAATIVPVFLCPSTARLARGREGSLVSNPGPAGGADRLRAAIDYGGIYGAQPVLPTDNGVLLYDRAVTLSDVTDGAAYTLAVAEDTGRGWADYGSMDGEWINGENIFDVSGKVNAEQNNDIWSNHPGGAMVLWCDGSATFLSSGTDEAVVVAACTRGGQETPTDGHAR